MPKTFCLLNHTLTHNQISELKEKFGSQEIIYPPAAISSDWGQIPAGPELDKTIINAVIDWLSAAENGDTLIIQGEFGSTFILVDYALKKGIVPIYAVTERVETEEKQGEKIFRHYVFEHVCFRKYAYYDA